MNKKKTIDKKDFQDKEYKDFIMKKIEEFNNNDKKTIVYFCDTFYPIIDGVIKVMDNYASRLCEKYNMVVVVPKHKKIVVKKDYLVIGVNSLYFKFLNYDLAFPNLDCFVNKALKKLNIDLIHSHSPFAMGSFAAKIAKKKKIPLVMTMHSQFKPDFEKHTKSKVLTNFMLRNICRVFGKSNEIWTMHEKSKQALQSYGYKKENFHFVPNATDYRAPENLEELRNLANQKYNLGKDELVFLFVGRMVEPKNIYFLADALNLVKQAGVKFKMFYVGDGPDKKNLTKRIQANNLTEDVIQTGKIADRNELATIYARSDLFLFASTYDTSSLVQIEAATYKTPSLLIKDTSTAFTVTDDVNAYLTELEVETFANKIIEIVSDLDKLHTIGQNAYRDLYVHWDDVAIKVSQRYEYLIEKNKELKKK